jgi:aspartokinase
MLVLKFGGTSVADARPISRAAAIVARAQEPCLLVVDAVPLAAQRPGARAELS